MLRLHSVPVSGATPFPNHLDQQLLNFKSPDNNCSINHHRFKETDMSFILTEPHLGNRTSMPVDQRFGSAEASRVTPVVFIVDPDSAMRERLERLVRREGWYPE